MNEVSAVETLKTMIFEEFLSRMSSVESISEKAKSMAHRLGRGTTRSTVAESPWSTTMTRPVSLTRKSHDRSTDNTGPSIPSQLSDDVPYSNVQARRIRLTILPLVSAATIARLELFFCCMSKYHRAASLLKLIERDWRRKPDGSARTPKGMPESSIPTN